MVNIEGVDFAEDNPVSLRTIGGPRISPHVIEERSSTRSPRGGVSNACVVRIAIMLPPPAKMCHQSVSCSGLCLI